MPRTSDIGDSDRRGDNAIIEYAPSSKPPETLTVRGQVPGFEGYFAGAVLSTVSPAGAEVLINNQIVKVATDGSYKTRNVTPARRATPRFRSSGTKNTRQISSSSATAGKVSDPMALLDRIKAQMFAAMKSGNTVEKEILKVAMGEITTDAARADKKGDDAETLLILKKLVKSNEESIAASQDETQKATLRAEIEVLSAFLPKSLGVVEIVAALTPVAEAVKAAGNDGQATGVAMKHLKSLGAEVNGKDVSAAVRQLRG